MLLMMTQIWHPRNIQGILVLQLFLIYSLRRRTHEQNEELGLNDMKTENYEEEEGDHTEKDHSEEGHTESEHEAVSVPKGG